MGLYRCLPYLVQSGMGAGKSAAELENERQSVIGARCWLAVSLSPDVFSRDSCASATSLRVLIAGPACYTS